jgi:long-chain acyl-CoA synthetase
LGLLLPNMPQTLVSMFGAIGAGVRPVFFDPLAEKEQLREQFNEAGLETLVLLDLMVPKLSPIFPQTKIKKFIVARVKDYLPFPKSLFFSLAARGYGLNVKLEKWPNLIPFKEFIATAPDRSPADQGAFGPDDVAVIQYCDGISGKLRAIGLTHGNLRANLTQVSAWLGKDEKGKEIFLSVLPAHQPEGLTLAVSLPIYLAALSVQLPQFDPGRAMGAIQKHRPSFFPAFPSMIESLANRPLFGKEKLSSFKVCLSVGEELKPEILENFEKKTTGKVITGYGPRRAPVLTHANPLYGKRKVGSIGIPLPDTEAIIVNPADGDKEMTVGETGELVVKGPQVVNGYLKQAPETGGVFRRGWLHTGDLARMDEDGFFYLMGRADDKRR